MTNQDWNYPEESLRSYNIQDHRWEVCKLIQMYYKVSQLDRHKAYILKFGIIFGIQLGIFLVCLRDKLIRI